MKERNGTKLNYILVEWYPSLPIEWKDRSDVIIRPVGGIYKDYEGDTEDGTFIVPAREITSSDHWKPTTPKAIIEGAVLLSFSDVMSWYRTEGATTETLKELVIERYNA